MPRDTLTREQIVRAATQLLDDEGLAGLNMRALGQRLGSAATAVYWHVGSKENLLTLAGDLAWTEIPLPGAAAGGWRAAMREMAAGLYAMLTRHPWLVQAVGSVPVFGPGKARHDDHALAILEAAGFAPGEADQAAAILAAYVLGNALGPAAAAAAARRPGRAGRDAAQVASENLARAKEIAAQFPRLRARLETPAAHTSWTPDGSFEIGVDAILDGLERRLARS
jgi:AcrR family transcriptional regulator